MPPLILKNKSIDTHRIWLEISDSYDCNSGREEKTSIRKSATKIHFHVFCVSMLGWSLFPFKTGLFFFLSFCSVIPTNYERDAFYSIFRIGSRLNPVVFIKIVKEKNLNIKQNRFSFFYNYFHTLFLQILFYMYKTKFFDFFFDHSNNFKNVLINHL
jgi:hypothetical protein